MYENRYHPLPRQTIIKSKIILNFKYYQIPLYRNKHFRGSEKTIVVIYRFRLQMPLCMYPSLFFG